MTIEFLQGNDRSQRVGLGFVGLWRRLGRVDNRLDFVRVNETSQVCVGHRGSRDALAVFSIDSIKFLQGSLGPDAETSHVATRGKLQKIQAVDTAEFDPGKVTERLFNTVVGGVDDQRSTTHGVTTVTHLTLTSTDLFGVTGLVHIIEGSNSVQNILCDRSLLGGLNSVLQNKRNFGNFLDGVPTGHDKGWDGRCGQGRSNSITLLVDVDLLVPLAPGLGGSKHASSTTHVTEGTLSGAGSTSTSNTRNTSDSTSGTPGRSGNLLASTDRNSISLTLVLVHVGVNKLDNVRTERSRHDGRESGLSRLVSGERENANERSGGHG
mmetsp:Transcript_25315/g.41564  ORF Transcript_25315/g.41564 Transcript_25315/m.41564 type:complete len:323 (+) Transcript_25315:1475-2443(+)